MAYFCKMSNRTLYDKVWDKHKISTLETGEDQIFIGLHLIHEVTTPQGFAFIRERGESVLCPNRTFATMDHIIPTKQQGRPFQDKQAEAMAEALEGNVEKFGIRFFSTKTNRQGIVHVIGPELGLSRPGMTIACGDSHTSTHGAFGALGFGIGTTQVGQVLQTQTLALPRLKVRKVEVNGLLAKGVYAKDVILYILNRLGVKGGLGYAYEYGGEVFKHFSMEERMTVCNMSIEGGARIGYVNPDEVTFSYIKGKEFAPSGEAFEREKDYWQFVASGQDAVYDDVVVFDGGQIGPMVTWGITPGQSVGIDECLPDIGTDQKMMEEAYGYMKFKPGQRIKGVKIDKVFIGSCTNSRISDLRVAAGIMKGKKVASGIKVLVVPGSQQVKSQAEAEGLHEIFMESGAEWRHAGCSMCLGMNPDRLIGDEICASTSNRNFIGRQGSPTGRTLLMSPAMAAAAAIEGFVVDVRQWV